MHVSSKEQANCYENSGVILYIILNASALLYPIHMFFNATLIVVVSFSVFDFSFRLKNSSEICFTEKPCSVEKIIVVIKIHAMCMIFSLKMLMTKAPSVAKSFPTRRVRSDDLAIRVTPGELTFHTSPCKTWQTLKIN